MIVLGIGFIFFIWAACELVFGVAYMKSGACQMVYVYRKDSPYTYWLSVITKGTFSLVAMYIWVIRYS